VARIQLLSHLHTEHAAVTHCVVVGGGGGGRGGGGGGRGGGGGKLISPDKHVGFMDVEGLSKSWSKTSVLSVHAAHVLLGCGDMLAL